MNARLIVITLLAVGLLAALILATGGGFSIQSSSSSPSPAPTVPPAARVRGAVRVRIKHLSGNTWRFAYRIHNTGTVPLAGFELVSSRANLFQITGRSGWSYYGSGVCGQQHGDVLIYWSTATTSPRVIQPGHFARFVFRVNTRGTASGMYSLSWDSARPVFGRILVPASSPLAAGGGC